jgi:hypothetical protein
MPSSRSKVRIPVQKGKLPNYHLSDPKEYRRNILNKIAKKDTWEEVVKRLNVLYIYNKNKHPEIASKFKRDMKYIHNLYSSSPIKKRSSKKKSKRHSNKKISKKRSSKKRSTKKRSSKKLSTKKRSSKKLSTKKRSNKQRTRKLSHKKSYKHYSPKKSHMKVKKKK